MKPRISQLTDKERDWVAQQCTAASLFVAAYSPDDADKPLSLACLDRAFSAWLGTQEKDVGLINLTINCVGAAFGQFLVDGLGFNWVVATDENGDGLAVLGYPGKGDVLIYPPNFVAKRWERGEGVFFEDSYKQISETVQNIIATAQTAKQRPWWKFW